MNKKNIAVGVLIAVIFFVAGSYHNSRNGYGNSWEGRKSHGYKDASQQMHMMADGTMMQNGHSMGDMKDSSGEMDMQQMMDSMMSGINGKTGDAFDKSFLSEMIVHHEGAVLMAQAVLKNSKRPELIELAKGIIAAQTKEINMMKGWEVDWFK